MNQPLVSIITVNYNQPEITAALLRSLSLLEYVNWEMIVVDNASPQHNSSSLKKEFPFIIHISSPINLGFAGGNNIGLFYAKGEYIFFANNDTELTPSSVGILIDFLKLNPSCGIACPKINYYNNPHIIQYAGAMGLHPVTSRSYDVGYLQKDDGRFSNCRETDLPHGAAMMVSSKLIASVGKMSEIYFLYYEELDWAMQFKKNGYPTHYVGSATILHKESISTGKNSTLKTYYLFRNRFLYIRRNYYGRKKIIAASFFILVSTPLHMFKHLFKKEINHTKAIAKAFVWNCKNSSTREPTMHSSNIISKSVIN